MVAAPPCTPITNSKMAQSTPAIPCQPTSSMATTTSSSTRDRARRRLRSPGTADSITTDVRLLARTLAATTVFTRPRVRACRARPILRPPCKGPPGTLAAGWRLVVTAGIVAPHGAASGKRAFPTGAASRAATALRLPAKGRSCTTDINADGLAQTVADPGPGARVPRTAPSTSPTTTRSPISPSTSTSTHHGAMDIVPATSLGSRRGELSTTPNHQHWRSMIDVNLMGPVHVIETFSPADDTGRGGRVNVSSAADWSRCRGTRRTAPVVPGCGLSEVLRFDLARHGIGVSLVFRAR